MRDREQDHAQLARMAEADPPELDRIEIIPSVTVFAIAATATAAAVALLPQAKLWRRCGRCSKPCAIAASPPRGRFSLRAMR